MTSIRRNFLTYFRMKTVILTVIIILVLFTTSFALYVFPALRDGTLYMQLQENDSVVVYYNGIYETETTLMSVYFSNQSGELIERLDVPPDAESGYLEALIVTEDGQYAMLIPGINRYEYIIGLSSARPAVYNPSKGYRNIPSFSYPLYVKIPPGCSGFKLGGKYSRNCTGIIMFDPSGAVHDTLILNAYTYNFEYDSLIIEAPLPGFWEVEPLTNGQLGLWVDSIPNYFAFDTTGYFVPVFDAGVVNISASGAIGTRPLLGSTSAGSAPPDAYIRGVYRDLGIQSINYYSGLSWREPVNDNSDPWDYNPAGFNWVSEDNRFEIYQDSLNINLLVLYNNQDSWLPDPVADYTAMEEHSEFMWASLYHHNYERERSITWAVTCDEPNLKFTGSDGLPRHTYAEYESLFTLCASRCKNSPIAEIRETKFIAPSSSNWLTGTEEGYLGFEWSAELITNRDSLIDGLSFDMWSRKELIENWRFKQVVASAGSIHYACDTDGNPEEEVIIGQTNFGGGGETSYYDTESFTATLWWAGVVCEAAALGNLTAIHWFPIVDEWRHQKGLLRSDGSYKPVAYGYKFVNTHLGDSIINTTCDQPWISAITSIDTVGAIKSLVVNKSRHQFEANIDITAPGWAGESFDAYVEYMDSSNFTSPDSLPLAEDLSFTYTLLPRTIYAFVFRPSSILVEEHQEIFDLSGDFDLTVYPNPFNGSIFIQIGLGNYATKKIMLGSSIDIGIYNLTGQMVFTMEYQIQKYTNESANCKKIIDPDNPALSFSWIPEPSISSGIYFVKSSLCDQSAVKRVVYLK
ncbi:T9SS type A sorting domain-containing protein [bacterium]|nr:T9SS type A sorting domain-containing protein [bacterium]